MKPELITAAEEILKAVRQARADGISIGLVPTMGALHAGHASLLRAARAECAFVIATVFVNPTQFGPTEDLSRYPRTLDQDIAVCNREGVDLVFAPDASVIYPHGFCTYVEVHGLQDVLCGAHRPGHFRGVATAVLKLFNLTQPDVAYFGQKDAQQVRIIQRMARDLDCPIRIRVCPIVREPDGLALSSRNAYLDPDQRRDATVLYRSLQAARELIESGERDTPQVRRTMVELIESTPHANLDYAEIVDAETLQPIGRLDGEILVALAVKFGETRLIDNLQMAVVCRS